jgi:hypothetical protein
MKKWKTFDEPVEMISLRFRYLPYLLRWRGERLEVEAVERTWTVSSHWGRQRKGRRYFRVSCSVGFLEIYHDLWANTWHLRRANLAPARLPVRRLAPVWR